MADPALARELAPRVSQHIYAKCCLEPDARRGCYWQPGAAYPAAECYSYDRSLVRDFQAAAGLSPADGLYGPATREALVRFGVANPPPALFGGGAVAPPALAPARVSPLVWILGGAAALGVVFWIVRRRR